MGSARADLIISPTRLTEVIVMSTCECGPLHTESRQALGCRECGASCCPSCAVEIDTDTYCRWCAIALAPAMTV
jgi:hypothetical protein